MNDVDQALARCALGVRLSKPTPRDWPVADWAVVKGGVPGSVVAFGQCFPPRGYSETEALRHLHEVIANAVQQHSVTKTLVWEIEGNARASWAMRPRIRAEGVVAAAATVMGSSSEFVAWQRIAALAAASEPKSFYASAHDVCGYLVGKADSQAVLVAVAALAS